MSTISSAHRGRTVQPKIVTAVVEGLRAAVPGYNDQNCFESDQPVPAAFFGGRQCCTVSIGAGSFPHEFFAGAGSATLVEDGSLIITPMIDMLAVDMALTYFMDGITANSATNSWDISRAQAWLPYTEPGAGCSIAGGSWAM